MKPIVCMIFIFSTSYAFTQKNIKKLDFESSYKKDEKQIINNLYTQLSNSSEDSVKSRVFYKLGNEYFNINVFDSSIYFIVKSQKIANKFSQIDLIKSCKILLGKNYYAIGNYRESLIQYLDLEKIDLKTNDVYNLLDCYFEIINLYFDLKDWDNVYYYSKEIKKISDNLDHNNKIWAQFTSLIYIGTYYNNKNNLDSALLYYKKALDYSIDEYKNNSKALFTSYANIGEVYFKLNKLNQAFSFYQKSKNLLNDTANFEYEQEFDLYIDIGKYYQKINKIDSSLFYSKRAFKKAEINNNKTLLIEASYLIYNNYLKQKKYDSLFRYVNYILDLKDSLFNEQKLRELENISINEKLLKQKEFDEKLERERQIKENQKLAAIGVFIPVFILVTFILGKKKKVNRKWVISLGLVSLLMLFEFISMLLHPIIESYTHHDSFLVYILLIILALILTPLHHRLEKYIKNKI